MKRLRYGALLSFVAVTISSGAFGAKIGIDQPALREALVAALRSGDSAAVNKALAAGADPNAKDDQGIPALMLAALYGDAKVVQTLLDRGADPNARNAEGATALIWAAGDFAKAQALVAKGADVKAQSALGRTPLHTAAAYDGNVETVKFLVERGADVNAPDRVPNFASGGVGSTPLMVAAAGRDSRSMRFLIEHGAKVTAEDSAGGTALFAAARQGSLENVKVLLAHGANPNAAVREFPFKGFTPMAFAAALERSEIVEALLAAGANPNAKDHMGNTPLTWAAMSERGGTRMVWALLEAGADRNVKGALDETPASWAARRGNTEIARMLGASPVQWSATAVKDGFATDASAVRAAIEKSVPPMLESGPKFVKVSGCISCHNNTLPLQAAKMAHDRGIPVRPANEEQQAKMIKGFFTPASEPLREVTDAIPDVAVSGGYLALGLTAQNVASDGMTVAVAHNIGAKQLADGSWPNFAPRAPIENGDIQATAFAVRTLQLYAPTGRKQEFARQIERAREWLRRAEPITTEDFVMQLYGLKWSGASQAEVESLAATIVAQQRTDGGWAQLETLSSDAYATGKVLVALRETGGLKPADAAYHNGVAFLMRTQQADGTWVVKARAFPFQPLKESGFPHGRDQWISAAATAWASMALSYSL